MKQILKIACIMLLFGCSKEREESKKSVDDYLPLYSDILIELEKTFYHRYLDDAWDSLGRPYASKWNSPGFRAERDSLIEKVKADTSKHVICLHDRLWHPMHERSYLSKENFNDSTNNPRDPRAIFKEFSTNYRAVFDSLTTHQNRLGYDNFKTTTFRVSRKCNIGMVGFSRVYFDSTMQKGLLYYEFFCGEKCAKGELLWIEKKENQWTIRKRRRLWVS